MTTLFVSRSALRMSQVLSAVYYAESCIKGPRCSLAGTVLKGFCMGTADIIPGVSGGTIALILGFYTRLIKAIRAFDSTLFLHLYRGNPDLAARHVDLGFLLSLGLGIVTALLFFTQIVSLPILLRTHPEFIYGLFFGLIIGSIGFLIRTLQNFESWDGLWLLFGVMLGYWIVNLVPMYTPEKPWFIFISGLLAACAMILPGISGSFVLLILKKYAYLLEAIGRFDFGVLVPFGLGALMGLLLFSRFLSWLLRDFYRLTFLMITGLLIGSLWVIWPFQARIYQDIDGKSRLVSSTPVWPDFDGTIAGVFGLVIIGIVIVVVLDSLAKRA
uniref:Putative membrane protein n=1 Tax=Candidatus Kentrum sp. TUN TaxID=2126343 RepID=A0A451A628_9GAMM|nr:MAG: putative membrane protein [Candidatus Kentron sp. TUN]